ncbi:MAG: adenylosuccinate synthase [Candidatus Shapirobacteria bacterium]
MISQEEAYRLLTERNVTIVVGTQWGDEGKGRATHYLAKDGVKMVIRATGGNNAGHTVVANGKKDAMHLLPSSIVKPEIISVIGNGVVVDPEVLVGEIMKMKEKGVSITPDNFRISDKAHLIMPWHREMDAIFENFKGKNKIGTTGRGIGPCFAEKAQRTGIRMIDLFDPILLKEKITQCAVFANPIIQMVIKPKIKVDEITAEYLGYAEILKPFICDTVALEKEFVLAGEKVLIEGAQAMRLDLDHGDYPNCTSSNPISSGALTGSGIGPIYVGEVIGVMKAYCSRVGNGPFPTEQKNSIGDRIRELGIEYGTTTGRPRRCGWLDLVMIKDAVFVNGLTSLCLNHIDTIGKLDEIKICVAYKVGKKRINNVATNLEKCKPVYITFKGGWDAKGITEYKDLPKNARIYIEFIEKQVGIPIKYIGTGADEKETIIR